MTLSTSNLSVRLGLDLKARWAKFCIQQNALPVLVCDKSFADYSMAQQLSHPQLLPLGARPR